MRSAKGFSMRNACTKTRSRMLPERRGGAGRLAGLLLCALVLGCVFASQLAAQQPADFYQQYCVSCHTIGGGPLIGPDLKGVEERKDRKWLTEFLMDPPAMIAGGDPYALKIQQESRGMVMPKVDGMDRARAEAILDFIKKESEEEGFHSTAVPVATKLFTAEDIARGRAIFLGAQKLEKGGSPCVFCHHVSNLGGLGGGRLGPDLTKVYERLGGQKNLDAWLQAPATTTMQPMFQQYPLTSQEIPTLVAFLEDSATTGDPANAVGLLYFFLLALGGTVVGLISFDTAWKHRFRSVRSALVHKKRQGETL